MAEILVKAVDATHIDPVKDARGCYKRGMPVVVMPDGTEWGNGEKMPAFALLKFPLISVGQLLKYIESYNDETDLENIVPVIVPVRRRLWQLRWADLPAAARNRLRDSGQLIIKATADYTGAYDYTWTQIRSYLRNLRTGLDETANL